MKYFFIFIIISLSNVARAADDHRFSRYSTCERSNSAEEIIDPTACNPLFADKSTKNISANDSPIKSISVSQKRGATDSNLKTVSVLQYGADPAGVSDSTMAFVNAIKSNRRILVPPGRYRIATQTQPSSTATDPSAIYVSGQSNFSIEGDGATLVLDPSIAFSLLINFNGDTDFSVRGLKFVGSRSGLTLTQENAAINLFNVENFAFNDINVTGFSGNGTAFVGDWIVNGRITNVAISHTSMCADVAFLYNVTFSHFQAVGDGSLVGDGSTVGNKCFSVIRDTPFLNSNKTSTSFIDSQNVSFTNSDVSNFITGILVENGKRIKVVRNKFHDNPGNNSTSGIGLFVNYNSTVDAGHPVSDLSVQGNSFINNGVRPGGNGAGITIANASLSRTSDKFARVSFSGNKFVGNKNMAIQATGSGGMTDLVIGNNSYSGSGQTLSPALSAHIQPTTH